MPPFQLRFPPAIEHDLLKVFQAGVPDFWDALILSNVQVRAKKCIFRFKPRQALQNALSNQQHNLWVAGRTAMTCQNWFTASCSSGLTPLDESRSCACSRSHNVYKIYCNLNRSGGFLKQHVIESTLHSESRLGPGCPQDFPLPVPRWTDFASAFQPWALEFAYPSAWGSLISRWWNRRCLSWHGHHGPSKNQRASRVLRANSRIPETSKGSDQNRWSQ